MNPVLLSMWCIDTDPPKETPSFSTHFSPPGQSKEVAGKRCSHFSVSTVELLVPGVYLPMQVPIYHCSLAEVMIERLRATEEGKWLADKLEAPPLDGQTRLICGPDLEAITTTTCIPDRCRRSCHAGYNQLLTELGLDARPPEE